VTKIVIFSCPGAEKLQKDVFNIYFTILPCGQDMFGRKTEQADSQIFIARVEEEHNQESGAQTYQESSIQTNEMRKSFTLVWQANQKSICMYTENLKYFLTKFTFLTYFFLQFSSFFSVKSAKLLKV
jgi:hypothetical protein